MKFNKRPSIVNIFGAIKSEQIHSHAYFEIKITDDEKCIKEAVSTIV